MAAIEARVQPGADILQADSAVAMVPVLVYLPAADAQRLAAHKRDRVASGLDILSTEAKEVANPVLQALVNAGL